MPTNTRDASYWISHLALGPHPEGGFYREVYRSRDLVASDCLPERFSGERSFCTSIFYLLEQGDFSSFHRIKSDETWHFYSGGPLEIIMLRNGSATTATLGQDISSGQQLQYTVPAETWFASRPATDTPFALLGCTVSPGFDFADFQMADRAALIKQFPSAQELITSLTRE